MKNKNCVFCFVIPLACTIFAATFATPKIHIVAKQSTKDKVNHYEQAHYNQTQPTSYDRRRNNRATKQSWLQGCHLRHLGEGIRREAAMWHRLRKCAARATTG